MNGVLVARRCPVPLRACFAVLCAVGLALAGCQSQPKTAAQALAPAKVEKGADLSRLKADLNAFALTFRNQVIGVASDVARNSKDQQVREAAVRWKIEMIPAIINATRVDDPRVGLVNLWALSVRQRTLADGEYGSRNFGDQAQSVRRAAHELEDDIQKIAAAYVPTTSIAGMTAEIEKRAAETPIVVGFASANFQEPRSGGYGELDQILKLPLAPIGAVNALGDTPAEIRNLTGVAGSFGVMLERMPEQLRWQMELLLLQSEDHVVFKDFGTMSAAAESLAATAKTLPADLGREIQNGAASVEGPIAKVNETVKEARALATQVDTTGQRVEHIATSIHEQADALSNTATAWQSTFHAVDDTLKTWQQTFPPSPPTDPPAPPFDIKDVGAIADQWRAAIGEARGLVADSKILSARLTEVDSASRSTIDHAAERISSLVDALLWKLGGLFAFGIVGLTAGRLVVEKYRRRGPK